jgi:hypothetical protein
MDAEIGTVEAMMGIMKAFSSWIYTEEIMPILLPLIESRG